MATATRRRRADDGAAAADPETDRRPERRTDPPRAVPSVRRGTGRPRRRRPHLRPNIDESFPSARPGSRRPRAATVGRGSDGLEERRGLKALIEKGKQTGSLTYDEVNAALPETVRAGPARRDSWNCSSSTASASSTPRRRRGGEEAPVAVAEEARSPTPRPAAFEDSDGDGRHIDDPVRMYLTQMGEIPLLDREQEIALAKKIEVTRRRFRRKVLECDYALRQVVETLKRVHTGDLPVRPHRQGVADREPGEGQDPPADAAQPADARTADGAERRGLPAAARRADRREASKEELRERLRAPPPQDRHAGRGAVDPHAEGPAADEEAGADLPRGWTSWSGRSRRCKGNRAAKEERANLREGTARPDAHHAGGAGQPAQARRRS